MEHDSVMLYRRVRFFCSQKIAASSSPGLDWRKQMQSSLFFNLLDEIEKFSEEECSQQPVSETKTYLNSLWQEASAPLRQPAKMLRKKYAAYIDQCLQQSNASFDGTSVQQLTQEISNFSEFYPVTEAAVDQKVVELR